MRNKEQFKAACLLTSLAITDAIQIHKSCLVLNHQVYVGMSVLDLSKDFMYDFYYNQMKAKYSGRVELLYNDTDSLLLEIQMEDVYEDMAKRADL